MNQPNDQIPIGLTLANCRGEVDALEVYDFIARQAPDTTAYAFRPRGIAAAALDFYLVLGAISSVASIANILWTAYDRFIAPRKRDANDSQGIYLAVRRPDGTVIDLMLGRDVLTKEDFTQQFELIIGDAKDPEFRLTHKATLNEIENSASWVRLDRD